MDKEIHGIVGKIKEKDFHLTPQRRIILNVLLQNKDKHLAVEDIYNIVHEKDKKLGMATIYRNLMVLEQLGVVRKLYTGEDAARYELITDKDSSHIHFICGNCGSIIDIDHPLSVSLVADILNEKGLTAHYYSMKIFGVCKKCRNSREHKINGEINDYTSDSKKGDTKSGINSDTSSQKNG